MARTPNPTAAADTTDKPDPARLESQIADLRADLARIAQTLADFGAAQGEAAAAKLADQGRAAKAQAEQGLADLEAEIRAHPLKAAGIAALAGLVLGLLLGRR